MCLIIGSEFHKRINRKAAPTKHRLQIVRVAPIFIVTGANVDEYAFSLVREKIADEQLLLVG
jgi:hypothetical protein